MICEDPIAWLEHGDSFPGAVDYPRHVIPLIHGLWRHESLPVLGINSGDVDLNDDLPGRRGRNWGVDDFDLGPLVDDGFLHCQ